MTRQIVTIDHSRHWELLARGRDLDHYLDERVQWMLRPGNAGGLVHGNLCHMVEKTGRLRVSALLDRRPTGLIVRAAYPYTESPYLWPLTLQKIQATADGGEGRLLGKVHAASVAVFDTLFFKNSERYVIGDVVQIQVSAIAYHLARETLASTYAPDFAGFAPLALVHKDSGAPPDEVEVHSVIEAAEELTIDGAPVMRYALALARFPTFTMTVEVYAPASPRFAPGDRVGGVLWLFAMAPDPALLRGR